MSCLLVHKSEALVQIEIVQRIHFIDAYDGSFDLLLLAVRTIMWCTCVQNQKLREEKMQSMHYTKKDNYSSWCHHRDCRVAEQNYSLRHIGDFFFLRLKKFPWWHHLLASYGEDIPASYDKNQHLFVRMHIYTFLTSWIKIKSWNKMSYRMGM